uniref:Uncharacterized protein LOC100185395 n=1 Tax=Phallusia mammillata TaxID=59560 RepID=A0A6F9DIZ4_9ASCI|nr:uncharacterized protein LOC100185395 [Phallusia mammillata]
MFVQECCDGLQIMLYFQAPVKQLGWPGITELECKIMGGCYVNNLCYYPPSSNQIQLRAGEDPLIGPNPTGRDLYGQPQCLPFDPNGSASSILDSYHSCRMAGCVMDPSFDAAKIRSYLCDIVKSDAVPVNLKKPFWDQVLQGIIGPHNWRQALQKLLVNICPNPYANNPLNSLFQNGGLAIPILEGCQSYLEYLGVNNNNNYENPYTTPNPFSFFKLNF